MSHPTIAQPRLKTGKPYAVISQHKRLILVSIAFAASTLALVLVIMSLHSAQGVTPNQAQAACFHPNVAALTQSRHLVSDAARDSAAGACMGQPATAFLSQAASAQFSLNIRNFPKADTIDLNSINSVAATSSSAETQSFIAWVTSRGGSATNINDASGTYLQVSFR